ncbi:MAG: DUF58 domain-containing protein [Planctomycetota bacterium]|nr:DUF58 domain-containing protein [Planctomycetota bacterium]
MSAYGFHVSFGSGLYFLGMMLIAFVAVNADVNLLMVVLGMGLGALVVNTFFNWMALRRISVTREAPDFVLAGKPFIVRYTITSRRRWGCSRGLHLVDVLPPDAPAASPETFISILRPRESLVIDVPAYCRSRGRLAFTAIAVATRFPFGLLTKYTTVFSRHEVVVFPELGRLLSDIRSAARSFKSADGQGTPSKMYGEEEYYGIREYRPGDNPRRIHWRRSARTGQLIVREMSSSQAVQLWCVLNTWTRQDDNKAHQRLESAISCAATVICDSLERGVKVGLICNGDPLVVLPPAGGRGHRPRLLRELALRGKNVGDELTPHLQRLAWPSRWRGPCMLFGADETEDLRRAADACNRLIGPASTYVPGTASFEKLFSDEGGRAAFLPGMESDDPMRLKQTARSA